MAITKANDNNPWNNKNQFKSMQEAMTAAKKASSGGLTYNVYQTSGGQWHFQPQYQVNGQAMTQDQYNAYYAQKAGSSLGQAVGKQAATPKQAVAPPVQYQSPPKSAPAPVQPRPMFSFDWSAADQEALAKLTPYYNQLLQDKKGDVEQAKGRLQEDYDNGVRVASQSQSMGNTQAQEDYDTQTQQDAITNAQNLRDARGQLNSRGVLVGQIGADQQGSAEAPVTGYAQDYALNPMQQQQQLRAQAVKRALTRQQEANNISYANTSQALATNKNRGTQDTDKAYTQYQKSLEEDKQNKAMNQMAPLAYQQAYQRYQYLNGQG